MFVIMIFGETIESVQGFVIFWTALVCFPLCKQFWSTTETR